MPQLKIPCALTKTRRSQINKVFCVCVFKLKLKKEEKVTQNPMWKEAEYRQGGIQVSGTTWWKF